LAGDITSNSSVSAVGSIYIALPAGERLAAVPPTAPSGVTAVPAAAVTPIGQTPAPRAKVSLLQHPLTSNIEDIVQHTLQAPASAQRPPSCQQRSGTHTLRHLPRARRRCRRCPSHRWVR
jgi:hypothetical protein